LSDPILSDEQARRLWERAAELQAEAAQKREAEEAKGEGGGSSRKLLQSEGDADLGYSLANIRQAGLEAGIQPDYLDHALAEKAILDLEGGSEGGWWDRTAKNFLDDKDLSLVVQRSFQFPAEPVWNVLEDTLTSEPHGLDLLEIWGDGPAAGGLAIFEAPYTYEDRGSLKYWSSVAEVRRYMVQIRPDDEESCTLLIRAPLRRTHRIHGAIGVGLSGLGAAVGGVLGWGAAAAIGAATGLAGIPLAATGLGLIGSGTIGTERLTRFGSIRMYRWGIRSLEKNIQKILKRVERDLQRVFRPKLPAS
jgi:hypothetical protein